MSLLLDRVAKQSPLEQTAKQSPLGRSNRPMTCMGGRRVGSSAGTTSHFYVEVGSENGWRKTDANRLNSLGSLAMEFFQGLSAMLTHVCRAIQDPLPTHHQIPNAVCKLRHVRNTPTHMMNQPKPKPQLPEQGNTIVSQQPTPVLQEQSTLLCHHHVADNQSRVTRWTWHTQHRMCIELPHMTRWKSPRGPLGGGSGALWPGCCWT
jgi:hypothetical protein